MRFERSLTRACQGQIVRPQPAQDRSRIIIKPAPIAKIAISGAMMKNLPFMRLKQLAKNYGYPYSEQSDAEADANWGAGETPRPHKYYLSDFMLRGAAEQAPAVRLDAPGSLAKRRRSPSISVMFQQVERTCESLLRFQ
jgi:hypothetical protein